MHAADFIAAFLEEYHSSSAAAPVPDLPEGAEEEVEVDDGLDEPGQGREEEADTDALSSRLAQELHAQLNNLRPRRR